MAFQHLDPKRAWLRTSRSRLFEYEPLKLSRHIRLLKISNFDLLTSKNWRATKPSRLPYYEMIQVPLDSLPEYTALSYAWGHPKRTHVLKISGAWLDITASLAEALRALSRIAPSEYLWIDQVCINQADGNEKNHQVRIMGEIYSNSHKVIIWTGGEIKGLQLAIDTYTAPGRQRCEGGSDWEAFDRNCLVDATPLRLLVLRPWFRRAWVVQEAVLAKVAIVMAGSCQLSLEDLAWATCMNRIQLRKGREAPGVGLFYDPKIVLDTIFALRHPSWTRMPMPIMIRTADGCFDSLILESLACTKASDPRDHVYAFLGLQKNPNISIVPDYSLSVPDAFTRAASAVIRGTNSLELLRFLPNNPSYSQLSKADHTGLPSWVPDWSASRSGSRILRSDPNGSSPRLIDRRTSSFDAAKRVPHRPNDPVLGSESKLVASGCVVDRIALPISSSTNTRFKALREYFISSAKERLAIKENRPRFFGLDDEEVAALDVTALSDPSSKLRNRLVVMLTGGCIGVAPPGVEEVLKAYDGEQVPSYPDMRDPLEWFLYRVSRLFRYIPVRSEKNKLALVEKEARVGDLVAILHGFQVPIVLRPTNEGSYTVVGQCYLEDSMFGEAMTWKEDEAEQFTLV